MPTQLLLNHLTLGQGQRWLAFVKQSRPACLTRLAQLMHASTGPIEEMDGSLGSLDPLFEWLVGFIEHDGFGLIDHAERGPTSIALGHERRTTDWTGEPIPWTPIEVLWSPIEAYVFEVARRIDPSASLELWPRPPRSRIGYTDDNRVGVMFGGEWKIIDSFVMSATPRFFEDWTDPVKRPTRDQLRRDVARHLGVSPDLPQPRGESILAPLLEHPVALPEIPRFDLAVASGGAVDEAPKLDADPVMFLDRSAGDDDPEAAAPLPLGPVTTLLTSLGATTLEGDPITRRLLLSEADQFVILDGAVLVETLVVKRKVRALLFEPGTATPAEWLHLLSRLDAAGVEVGAHVVPTEGL